jgi:hypothetical protein
MYQKTIKHNDVGPVTYTIYQQAEADDEGIKYKPWQEAEVGEYAITDDGWVSKVIKRKEYDEFARPDRKGVYIYTPVGTIIWHKKYKKTKFYKGSRKNIHSVSGKSYQYVRSEDSRNKLMARWFALSGDLAFSIQMSYGDIKPNKAKSLRVLAKTEAFKSMVTEEMRALLDEKNLGKKDTIALIQRAIEMAEAKENIPGFIRMVENLIELNHMKEVDTVKDTMQLSMTRRDELADVIESEERTLKITSERQKDEVQEADVSTDV